MTVHQTPPTAQHPTSAPADQRQRSASAAGMTLDVEGVSHDFGSFRALDDVDLNVDPGEMVALLGPSGCGKTTLLRVIAGFLRQKRGSISVDGRPVDDRPAGRRNVGIVFQSYALFPHMTAAQNVGYGLAAAGRPRRQISEAVRRFLDVVQMGHLAERLPRELSGGQQQRVALARALAVDPGVLLLDEPFAALDKNLRLDMQIEIKRLQRQLGLTAILVTHDQEEAMSIADRVAVMNGGRIEQLGAPVDVYDRPVSLFVNGFIGSTNLLPGRIAETGGSSTAIDLDAGARVPLHERSSVEVGARALLSVRPEHLSLSDQPDLSRFLVDCRLSLPLGGLVVLDLATPQGATLKLVRIRSSDAQALDGPLYCGLGPDARPSIFPEPT